MGRANYLDDIYAHVRRTRTHNRQNTTKILQAEVGKRRLPAA